MIMDYIILQLPLLKSRSSSATEKASENKYALTRNNAGSLQLLSYFLFPETLCTFNEEDIPSNCLLQLVDSRDQGMVG